MFVYFYKQNGCPGIGCCEGTFAKYPPTMSNICALHEEIKEKFSYDEVVLLNWLPLAEEKTTGDEGKEAEVSK